MNVQKQIKNKENVLIRFCKLTEEALLKIENKKEEDLPLIMDKRDKLLKELEVIQNQLKEQKLTIVEQGAKIQELESQVMAKNKDLKEKMDISFKELKTNIGKNKKAIKINKAYQGQLGESMYLNKKN